MMRHVSALLVLVGLFVISPPTHAEELTCKTAFLSTAATLTSEDWYRVNETEGQDGLSRIETNQLFGYIIGKALAVVDPDSQAAACLEKFRTDALKIALPVETIAFNAGLAGLPPPNIDLKIGEEDVGPHAVRQLGGAPIPGQEEGSALLGTWDMNRFIFEVGDATSDKAVPSGGYVLHFGDDNIVTVGQSIFNETGKMTTAEGTWSHDSTTNVVAMDIDGEKVPWRLVSATPDRLEFLIVNENTRITMVFARSDG